MSSSEDDKFLLVELYRNSDGPNDYRDQETMEYKSLSFLVARWRPRQDQTFEMYVLIYLSDGDDRRQVRLKTV